MSSKSPTQARTRLARTAVVDAARRLFLEHGYGATTIDAISETADVPPATLYRLFASKVGVLKSILDVSIVGDDNAIPVAERPEVRALLADPEPRSKLAGFAKVTVEINGRVAPLYLVLVTAAGSDSEAASLLEDITRQREQGQRRIVRSLARGGSLRSGLRERDAADLVHALMSPELFRLLVLDRGWSIERYESWLTETLSGQLLADA